MVLNRPDRRRHVISLNPQGHAAKKAHSSSQDCNFARMGLTLISPNFYHNCRRFPWLGIKRECGAGIFPMPRLPPQL